MEHNHKEITKTRAEYKNKKSYDDELAIVLYLLQECKIVEKEITEEFKKAFEELYRVYKEEFPFYYRQGVLNSNKFQKLFISLSSSGKGSFQTRFKEVIESVEKKTRELQTQRLMAWLILDYEITAQKTAQSIGKDPSAFINTLLSKQNVENAVKIPWCKDGKSFLDRITLITKDMDAKLRAVILKGIREGWSLDKMSKYFQKITGMAAYKAARLIRTETMAVYSKATKDMFLENGIEYVEIIGDAACGGICLDYVGDAIPLREAELGDDLPPYHPNCACSFCSYIDFNDEAVSIGYELE